MAVKFDIIPSPAAPSSQDLTQQVDRILRSNSFRGSEILRNLLSYLASCTLEGRSEPVKVKEIAVAVFGRSADFDSQSDSVVRVHTGRLRSKLAEYYMGEGEEDEIIVSIPKGCYALACHFRHLSAVASTIVSEPLPEPAVEDVPVRDPHVRPRGVPVPVAAALIVLTVLLTLGVKSLFRGTSSADENASPGLRTMWQNFLAVEDTPLIVFSNLRISDPFDPARTVVDTYTTVGEVMGVFNVSRILSSFHETARAKRGRLLTWDDAKDGNLIFVGGPLAETPLREVSLFTDFQFKPSASVDRTIPSTIQNLHPRPGEALTYSGPGPRPFAFDYALVAFRPGFTPHHWIMALAGVTEFGTWAASEFMTREDRVNDLLSRLAVKPGEPVPAFEALLRVRIESEVPVQTQIVLVHKIK